MSLILEALRKSEAERQRGRAPGLFVEQRPVRSRERTVPAWAWGLGAVLVIVLLAWGWRESQRPVAVTLPAMAPDTVVEAAPTDIAERMDGDAAATDGLAPIILTPRPEAERTAAAARSEASPVAMPSQPTTPPPADARTDAAAAASPPRAAPVTSAEVASGAMAAPKPGTLAGPPVVTSAPTPSDAPAPLPGLGTLAAADRATLPPLKLSMHVYAPEPAQRFVILDGQRLGEGASPAAGVVLEEIRRDGLVLSVNGQRLLLARP